MQKLPPIEKIYEAYSAIADGRVIFSETGSCATVASSDRVKEYTVSWDGDVYSSNDNATYWQGYAGYPVLAVLMLQDRLTLDKEIVYLFNDVNWKDLNDQYKHNYTKAVDAVIQERNLDEDSVHAAAAKAFEELKGLGISIKRGSSRPPKSAK